MRLLRHPSETSRYFTLVVLTRMWYLVCVEAAMCTMRNLNYLRLLLWSSHILWSQAGLINYLLVDGFVCGIVRRNHIILMHTRDAMFWECGDLHAKKCVISVRWFWRLSTYNLKMEAAYCLETSSSLRITQSYNPQTLCILFYTVQTNYICTSSYLLYLVTYGAEPFLRSCQLCSHSGTSQHFKEPEGSSPRSQEPSIGPKESVHVRGFL
jgi:hypothetical protein